jgi:hypothetical protein
MITHLGRSSEVINPKQAAHENRILVCLQKRGTLRENEVKLYTASTRRVGREIHDRAVKSLVKQGLIRKLTTTRSNSFILASNLVTLNGGWDLYVHGRWQEAVTVPSSLRPKGFYRLQRSFLLPRLSPQERAILHFEAITYYARLRVNGHELGKMVPYVPHEFDFTAYAQEGNNSVEVDIVDACPGPDGLGKDALTFGITAGWETYGGIIRDVRAEIRPSAFVIFASPMT